MCFVKRLWHIPACEQCFCAPHSVLLCARTRPIPTCCNNNDVTTMTGLPVRHYGFVFDTDLLKKQGTSRGMLQPSETFYGEYFLLSCKMHLLRYTQIVVAILYTIYCMVCKGCSNLAVFLMNANIKVKIKTLLVSLLKHYTEDSNINTSLHLRQPKLMEWNLKSSPAVNTQSHLKSTRLYIFLQTAGWSDMTSCRCFTILNFHLSHRESVAATNKAVSYRFFILYFLSHYLHV